MPIDTSTAGINPSNQVNNYRRLISGNTAAGLQVLQNTSDQYGIGITLPFTSTDASPMGLNIAYSTAQAVQSDLINRIMTQKGERLGNPTFGTDLHKFLFRQNTVDIEPLIEEELKNAMKEYESDTGIGIDNVNISIHRFEDNGAESHTIKAVIQYEVVGDVQQIIVSLMNNPDIGTSGFSSYKTTSQELSNTGTPLGYTDTQWIDSGFDVDEFAD